MVRTAKPKKGAAIDGVIEPGDTIGGPSYVKDRTARFTVYKIEGDTVHAWDADNRARAFRIGDVQLFHKGTDEAKKHFIDKYATPKPATEAKTVRRSRKR